MIHLLSIALCALGFLALGATQKRHQHTVFARPLTPREVRRGRAAGVALLALALGGDGATLGTGLGTIAWTGHLSLGAAMVVAVLHWRAAR
ncbi:DUF3325 domain-containing protein [Novosphingobium sp. 1949]|uniref:DUF3325 domain-containing protein n=1 Tax=Novosphingobium organovorum TaxID=2930092 RepID=A0ABT0BBY5_9SPHN|nr:DUF3325 domain-containing protein [Novosphingobium organovorum]MCJ2182562.1 DUF3325 domain-containing protein [Novosphingobium organovorum]